MNMKLKLMLFTIFTSLIMFILATNIIFALSGFDYPPGNNKYAIFTIWIFSAINIIIRSFYYSKEY